MRKYFGLLCLVLLAEAFSSFATNSVTDVKPPGIVCTINVENAIANTITFEAPAFLQETSQVIGESYTAILTGNENQLPTVRSRVLPYKAPRDGLTHSTGNKGNVNLALRTLIHRGILDVCGSARDWVTLPIV